MAGVMRRRRRPPAPLSMVAETAGAPGPGTHLTGELDGQDISAAVQILDAHDLEPGRFGVAPAAVVRPFATGQGGMVYYGRYSVRPGARALDVAVKFALSVDNREAHVEAEMLSKLNHSLNVIGFFGKCWWENRMGMVMELANYAHRTLDDLLRALEAGTAAWTMGELWAVVRGVATGLDHIHERGISHMDIRAQA